MRNAFECRAMAARVDARAGGDEVPHIRAEWLAIAAMWRDLAREAERQDGYALAVATA
jgi:hypothetical protein